MLFISPPFGNYLELPYTRSIKGSFTLQKRDGLLFQIISTLRYSFEYGGWKNKIGLRNKGIDWAINKYRYSNSIISIAILDKEEIPPLLEKIPPDMDLEINISCPNIQHSLVSDNIHLFINPDRKWCSIKLSPTTDIRVIDKYYQQGFRKIHFSNTFSTTSGGISGPYLIPYTSKLITIVKNKYPDSEIIAGGGIRSMDTINIYKNLGASHFSISTLLFNPLLFSTFYYQFYRDLKKH